MPPRSGARISEWASKGSSRRAGDRVVGILNGIDPATWNPETDAALNANYSARSVASRTANKRALEAEFHLERDDGPLFIVVSRLTWQKGMDVLPEVLDHLVGNGGRLALLGSGDSAIEDALREGAARHPGRIGLRFGYDEALSHRLQGGGDAILVPSRFEPCGLTQLYGLAYGCVPVVARTGGLADTIVDANVAALAAGAATGVQFSGVDYHGLAIAISRTVSLYRDRRTWRAIQRNGMKADFSWTHSGQAYADTLSPTCEARRMMTEVPTKPFDGQKPGTSGLRKKVHDIPAAQLRREFHPVGIRRRSSGSPGATLVIGGDGRFLQPTR